MIVRYREYREEMKSDLKTYHFLSNPPSISYSRTFNLSLCNYDKHSPISFSLPVNVRFCLTISFLRPSFISFKFYFYRFKQSFIFPNFAIFVFSFSFYSLRGCVLSGQFWELKRYLMKFLLSMARKLLVFSLILMRFFQMSLMEAKMTNTLPSKCSCFFSSLVKFRPRALIRQCSSFLHMFMYLFFCIQKNLIHSSTSDSTGSMKTIVSWCLVISELLVEFLAAESPFDFWSYSLNCRSEFFVLLKREEVFYLRKLLTSRLYFSFFNTETSFWSCLISSLSKVISTLESRSSMVS